MGTGVENVGRSSVVPCGKNGRGKVSGMRRGWLVWFGQTRKRKKVKVLVAQLCLTLQDSMDCSPPGPSVHGTLEARMPEWVAIPFSTGSPGNEPGSPALQADSLLSEPPRTPTREVWAE